LKHAKLIAKQVRSDPYKKKKSMPISIIQEKKSMRL